MASGTDGNIISYDASGNPVAVATGGAGQILTSAGAGAVPSFQAAAAGGKVLQVVSGNFSSEKAINSTSYVDTDVTLNITPSATSSKVMVIATLDVDYYRNRSDYNKAYLAMYRGSTALTYRAAQIGATSNTGNDYLYVPFPGTMSILDSPSSTNAVTYKIQAKTQYSDYNTNMRINGSYGISALTLMEIST